MLANCPECHKPFMPKPGLRVCNACVVQEQEYYQTVYGYVLKRPGSTLDEVAEKTGVPKDVVLRLMKQGRIQPGKHIQSVFFCSRCDAVLTDAEMNGRDGITAKLLCRICAKIMAGQLKALGYDPVVGAAQQGYQLEETHRAGFHTAKKSEKRYGLGSNRH